MTFERRSAAGSSDHGDAPEGQDQRGSVGSRYRHAVKAVGSAQKPGAGVPAYTRWVNRRLARYAAAAAVAIGWGPNAVTVASAVASAIAITLLVSLRMMPAIGVIAAILLALGYLLDSADGQVARLTGRGSPAGEWLDHVVDAIRTPAIHLAVMVGIWRSGEFDAWVLVLPIAYCLIAVGQFMSQILAEQLARAKDPAPEGRGIAQSIVLIPTDTGTLCWTFLAWGFPPVFLGLYGLMFLTNAGHSVVSMHRKYRKLVALATI